MLLYCQGLWNSARCMGPRLQIDQPWTAAANIPVYNLAKLSPGLDNPLGIFWNRFREWLRDLDDVLTLIYIILFVGWTAADVCTIGAAAVKARPWVAVAVGRRLYDTHCQLYQTTMKQHRTTSVSTENEHEESTSE